MRNRGLDPKYLEWVKVSEYTVSLITLFHRDPDAPAPPMDGSTGASNLPRLPARQQSSGSSSSDDDSDYEFESD